MAFTDEDRAKMDNAASEAQQELDEILGGDELPMDEAVSDARYSIISWFSKWHMTTGHKRLGRIIVAESKAHDANV